MGDQQAGSSERTSTKIAAGVVAGVVAGAVASFAMDRFQAAVSALSTDDDSSEPATEKAADAIARQISSGEVSTANKALAGQAIHYGLGIGLGVAYAIAAEFSPAVATGRGTAFGLVTATVLDEGAVPAIGLGDAAWKVNASTTAYAYASHLVFGAATELVRRQVRMMLTRDE